MRRISFSALLSGLLVAPLPAQSPYTPPSASIGWPVDSGYLTNRGATAQVVFREQIRVPASGWLQITFGEVVSLPEGSFLRMTSLADGAVQRHTARTLADWGGLSAAFNGDHVSVELVAGPRTVGNRVTIRSITHGVDRPEPDSICGPVDNRVASNDPRQGRLFVGCTGWMIGPDVMLTAGHCVSGSTTTIVEFNVPVSSPSGSIRRSHPDDQYPFTILQSLNAGVGSDWAVNRVGPNSNHGQLPTQRNNGQWYSLGTVPSPNGNSIRITGYGSQSGTSLNLAQKTHVGPLAQTNPTSLCYVTDTTGGNSGSPVIHENTGDAIGIHTHGGCQSSGNGCNSGTRVDRNDLRAAILAASQTPGRFTVFAAGCPGTGQTPPTCATANGSGGQLSNDRTANEYAYTATTPVALSVTAFEVWSASTTGAAATVTASIYTDANGGPASNPVARTTMSIGTTAGFHRASFPAPVAIPAGRFYVAVDHSAGTTYVANLTSGTAGTAHWRRPPLTGGWQVSSLVTVPSFRVLCQGGGSGNATPAITGAGVPMIGQQYTAELRQGRAGTACSMLIGFSRTSWTGGSLPFSLAGLGAGGCNLLVDPSMGPALSTDVHGSATLPMTVPNDAQLIGFSLFHQAIVIDPGANALGVAASNGLEVRIGG